LAFFFFVVVAALSFTASSSSSSSSSLSRIRRRSFLPADNGTPLPLLPSSSSPSIREAVGTGASAGEGVLVAVGGGVNSVAGCCVVVTGSAAVLDGVVDASTGERLKKDSSDVCCRCEPCCCEACVGAILFGENARQNVWPRGLVNISTGEAQQATSWFLMRMFRAPLECLRSRRCRRTAANFEAKRSGVTKKG